MRRNGDRSGITLVEILVTTSLIVVMVGALFVVQRGVSRQSQTTASLAVGP